MNKKGAMVLRDIMFMIIIFAAVMALASVFVMDMAAEYENTNMSSQYYASDSVGSLGSSVFLDVNESVSVMRTNVDDSVGSFSLATTAIKGMGAILKAVVLAPVYVGTAITTMFVALRIPNAIATILGNTIIFLIYSVIIFVIGSALLRGGKV